MSLFEKRITIFKKKDAQTWKKIKSALKAEGIRGVRSGHYFADAVAPNGIGGQLDPRNYGSAGRIDRDIYFVEVKESQAEAAREAIRKHGIVAVVDEQAGIVDEAVRVSRKEKEQ